MKYDRLIIEILMEAGSDGLTVRKVSRHVFNAVNGLFDEADIEAVTSWCGLFCSATARERVLRWTARSTAAMRSTAGRRQDGH